MRSAKEYVRMTSHISLQTSDLNASMEIGGDRPHMKILLSVCQQSLWGCSLCIQETPGTAEGDMCPMPCSLKRHCYILLSRKPSVKLLRSNGLGYPHPCHQLNILCCNININIKNNKTKINHKIKRVRKDYILNA